MPLPPNFPSSPFAVLSPEARWLPDAQLPGVAALPPLVPALRKEVQQFRANGYAGASDTSRSLLNWWFNQPHFTEAADGTRTEFAYYFAQREAVETVVFLTEAAGAQQTGVKDKHDLMRYDASGQLRGGQFAERWLRYMIKMATGSGKTKVMSLLMAWSYFHRRYEADSPLSRNFLLVAPNIIVLDRLYKDFGGCRIFFADPVLPDDGHDGRDWRSDFQMTLHKQDNARPRQDTGNIFLTNIHRVFMGQDAPPSAQDDDSMGYFLGPRPSGKTNDQKTDLGAIVRNIDELLIINDEAHHVHDKRLAWFQSIEDIHNHLLLKDKRLCLQIDLSATPRHQDGAVFCQTVCDYPLVEAIAQNVVKRPVLPDDASRALLRERPVIPCAEKYQDYLELGVTEWRRAAAQHAKLGKKAILFVMTDNTANCDEVADYLQSRHPDLQNAVLTIHTNQHGAVAESASGKAAKEQLENLRRQANDIDRADNPYKAIVSVLMLKEGWDVRCVTTLVGLRPYGAAGNILPEQTLGRGLRRMYGGDVPEEVSVIGTDAFMEFVESITQEGVTVERRAMGADAADAGALLVEPDLGKPNAGALDIAIPVLPRRVHRRFDNALNLDIGRLQFAPQPFERYGDDERTIVFRYLDSSQKSHQTEMGEAGQVDYRAALQYFTERIAHESRCGAGYKPFIYGEVKRFARCKLFGQEVDLEGADVARNLARPAATQTLIDAFVREIVALIGAADEAREEAPALAAAAPAVIKLSQAAAFRSIRADYLVAKKSLFNYVVCDQRFELAFAQFLERGGDVAAFAKNYDSVGFKLDYIRQNGDIADYVPDFIVKLTDGRLFVVECKGREEADLSAKMLRLRQWCEETRIATPQLPYDFVFVDQKGFEAHRPKTFADLAAFSRWKTEE